VKPVFDIVIVGGGLSGLALAEQLAAPEFSHLKVLVLESRVEYVHDRTWSYWRTHDSPHAHLERQRWTQWRVSGNGKGCTVHGALSAGQAQYCTVEAGAFYRHVLLAIGKCQHVQLMLGTPVHEIRDAQAEVPGRVGTPSVLTAKGQRISAQWVFDARPPLAPAVPVAPPSNNLVQQFVGWEVHTQTDVFDTDCVHLMDFVPCNQGLHFFYVLPYSPRNALVESTWVSPASHRPDYRQELNRYLARCFGVTAFETPYQEHGVLALQHRPPPPGRSVRTLGRGAGTLRPATGYAYLDTLAHSRAIAESLGRHPRGAPLALWQPPSFKRSPLDNWMDKVFLRVLQNDWQQAVDYFLQMFSRTDSKTLVAFLSGQASLAQRLKVARVLPAMPFIRSALAGVVDLGRGLQK